MNTQESQVKVSHTPGPWRVMNSHKAGFLNVYATHWTGELEATDFICEVGPGDRGGRVGADADIIAAALDLLEACKSALRWMNDNGFKPPVISDLENAIAKATAGRPVPR